MHVLNIKYMLLCLLAVPWLMGISSQCQVENHEEKKDHTIKVKLFNRPYTFYSRR